MHGAYRPHRSMLRCAAAWCTAFRHIACCKKGWTTYLGAGGRRVQRVQAALLQKVPQHARDLVLLGGRVGEFLHRHVLEDVVRGHANDNLADGKDRWVRDAHDLRAACNMCSVQHVACNMQDATCHRRRGSACSRQTCPRAEPAATTAAASGILYVACFTLHALCFCTSVACRSFCAA